MVRTERRRPNRPLHRTSCLGHLVQVCLPAEDRTARHGQGEGAVSRTGRAWAFRVRAVVLTIGLFLGLTASASAGRLAELVFETTLGNGLKVLIVEEPKAPVVAVQVWYKVGSRNEETGRTGLSHMLEHMMFKGTSKVGPKQFDMIVTRNGGVDNAETQMDFTG